MLHINNIGAKGIFPLCYHGLLHIFMLPLTDEAGAIAPALFYSPGTPDTSC